MITRARPWVMRMRWCDLLFMHWPVDSASIRSQIPAGLDLDLFEGRAYVAVVPFRMENVGPRGLPAPPLAGAFPELNVRTYVRHQGSPGVWFFSLDAADRVAVEGARASFHLPYYHADMAVSQGSEIVDYRSDRTDDRGGPARFAARYRPTGPVERFEPGSFEVWSTDRQRLFALDRRGRLVRTEVRHAPWPLQPATVRIEMNSMLSAAGLVQPDEPPHVRFAARLDVRGWWPKLA